MARGWAARRWRSEWWTTPVLALYICLAAGYVALWLQAAGPDWFARADFTSFYAGWAIVRDGRGAALYDLAVQGESQAAALPGVRFAGGVLPYVNPPHLTLPFVPLAWLPRPVAFTVWTLVQLGLLAWLVRWLWRDVAAGWPLRERRLLVAGLLAFHPLLHSFLLGAFSLLLLVVLARFHAALAAGRERSAGLWLLLGTLKPQLVLLPGVMALAAGRWRVLATAAFGGGLLAVAATGLLGWRTWDDYLRLTRDFMLLFDRMGVDPSLMWNARGTLASWLGPQQVALINTVSMALVALAAASVWRLWRAPWRPGTTDFDLRFALTVLLGLLTAPHLFPHDGLLLVLPAALGYRALRDRAGHGRPDAALLLASPPLCLLAEWTAGGRLGVRLPVLIALTLAARLALALRHGWHGQPALPAAAGDGGVWSGQSLPASASDRKARSSRQ